MGGWVEGGEGLLNELRGGRGGRDGGGWVGGGGGGGGAEVPGGLAHDQCHVPISSSSSSSSSSSPSSSSYIPRIGNGMPAPLVHGPPPNQSSSFSTYSSFPFLFLFLFPPSSSPLPNLLRRKRTSPQPHVSYPTHQPISYFPHLHVPVDDWWVSVLGGWVGGWEDGGLNELLLYCDVWVGGWVGG